jgi:uncharacterized membrane protein
MKSARSGEVRISVDADANTVWATIANLDRMGEWSPECYRVEWLDGASSPARPGARFKGWNRSGPMKWSMTCEVKEADPGRVLAWSTVQRGRELVRWTYRLEPEANGRTELIESFVVQYLPPVARLAEDVLMRDRDRRRKTAMKETLERIKSVVEAAASQATRDASPTTSI